MPGKLLIVEDNEMNIRILSRIFAGDYEITTAADGREALAQIRGSAGALSAVILDLQMPVMDGFTVLSELSKDDILRNLPVIVATGHDDVDSETRALWLGAWDFVTKPYNAAVLKFRVENAIERNKFHAFDQVKSMAEHDRLTGLLNASTFYAEARALIDAHPEQNFVVARIDIERFKQFNTLFGRDAGDDFLKYIASLVRKYGEMAPSYVCARIVADVFAACASYESLDKYNRAMECIQEEVKNYSRRFHVSMIFGNYLVDDRTLSVGEMLDRATLASKSIKGHYLENVAWYTGQMGEQLHREQVIANEMNEALEQRQFCVYYQPKYNILTGMPCGAEALVRWNHPERGMISPGVFIPLFEKNGFIAKLDLFVWEEVCRCLKKWMDSGFPVLPVSVNVSRVNLSNPRIAEILTDLVTKYGIPSRLLELEITESAYMDSPENMKNTVEQFHEKGFTVLMDDFGSGYFSLNTLKEISVDILKIDMKFLPTGDKNPKSEKILASVIRMANWLGMPAIVEGVETQTQKEYLKSVGCQYAQGYYYARPMPQGEYEKLITGSVGEGTGQISVSEGFSELDAVLSSDPATEALLSGIPIPVAIFEVTENGYDRLRANNRFFDVFGYQVPHNAVMGGISQMDRESARQAMDMAIATHDTADCDLLFFGSASSEWYRLQFRYIMSGKSGHLISAVYTDITHEKRVASEMSRIVGILNQKSAVKRKMLIVDDAEINRMSLALLFSDEFEILEAENGQVALDILRVQKEEISLILLDLYMPVMDGNQFLAVKNHTPGASEIPVIVVSSEQDQEVQLEMLRSGVNDYIVTPFVPEVVKKRVRNVLDFQNRFVDMVREFRKTLSLSPTIGKELLLSYLTLPELRALILYMQPIFDVVRIVDPTDTAILNINEDNTISREPYSCFKVWNRKTRCENCSSLCAGRNHCQMSKYEFVENDIFYVISRPMEVIMEGEESLNVVLEIVSHVSDSLMLQKINGVTMREAVESTRQKIYGDPLTGANNRRYLYEMLFLNRARNDLAQYLTFVMVDINRFKEINDTYGHEEGDRVLTAVAKQLRETVSASDAVIRFGGDEFLVILTDCRENEIDTRLRQIREGIESITCRSDPARHIFAKIGYSHCENFDSTREMLDREIKKADENMYAAHKASASEEKRETDAH